jgi:hypothetical protein
MTHRDCRRSRQRAAASVEAVVIMPFLIMVYFGVTLVFGRYDAAQRAWASARGCAWSYSQQGCQGALPAECGAATAGPSALPRNAELDGATNTENVQAPDEEQQNMVASMNNTLGEPRSTLFGEYVTVTASGDFAAPAMFGDRRRVAVQYYTACNLRPQTLGDIARGFVDAVLP